MEHILRNALLALLDQPEATLEDVLRLLSDREFRRDVMTRVANIQVRDFWLREYESYPARFRIEAVAPGSYWAWFIHTKQGRRFPGKPHLKRHPDANAERNRFAAGDG